MDSATWTGLEEWLPQRAVLLTAAAMWTAGFVLAGASICRMQHTTAWTYETSQMPASAAASPGTPCDNASSDVPAGTDELHGAVFMPQDVVVGRGTPSVGITQMQKR